MQQEIATLTDYGADPSVFLAALRRLPGFDDVAAGDLEPMPVKGLVHAHIRIKGRGLVLRVPRLSHFGHDPVRSLAYQAACFERAWPSGATPELYGVIPVQPRIPNGALVVEEGVQEHGPHEHGGVGPATREVGDDLAQELHLILILG